MITMQHFVHPDGCDTIGMCLDSGQTMGILWESYEKTCWEIHGKPMGNYGKLYVFLMDLMVVRHQLQDFEGGIFWVPCFPSPISNMGTRWPGLHNWAPLGCGPCQTQRPGRMAKHGAASGPYQPMDTVENTQTYTHKHKKTDRCAHTYTSILHLYTLFLKKKHVHKNKHDYIHI